VNAMKRIIWIFTAIALVILAACTSIQTGVGVVDNALPGELEQIGGNEPMDDLFIRERFREKGFTDAEIDSMIASGVRMELILIQDYYVEYLEKIAEHEPLGPSGEIISPEYYGGSYFDDYGVLTIMVLDEAYNHAASAVAIAEMSELGIKIKSALFSEIDLKAALDTFNHMDKRMLMAGVTNWDIDTIENRVYVDLDPYTDEQIAIFQDLLRDTPIKPAMIDVRPAVTRDEAIASAIQSPSDKVFLYGDVEVSRTGISFFLENRADLPFCGEPWDLVCYTDAGWMPVSLQPERCSYMWVNQIGSTPQGYSIIECRIDLNNELPLGRYIYILDGWLGDLHMWQETIYVLVEFVVTEDSPEYLAHQFSEELSDFGAIEDELGVE